MWVGQPGLACGHARQPRTALEGAGLSKLMEGYSDCVEDQGAEEKAVWGLCQEKKWIVTSVLEAGCRVRERLPRFHEQ